MSAVLLKGAEIAKKIALTLRSAVRECEERSGSKPTLAVVRIGTAPDAALYANAIRRVMEELGARFVTTELADDTPEEMLRDEILKLARSEDITGILLLSPLPKRLDRSRIEACIPAGKDAEGARGLAGSSAAGVWPPTALAILSIADATGIPLAGKDAVVVGRSRIVGLPAAHLLLQRDATVTICHSKTADLAAHVRRADIVVAAAGQAGLIRGEWIKEGAIVIDAGENKTAGGIVGDVAFAAASNRAAYITPVPSGVGPLTTYMLARNLLTLADRPRAAPSREKAGSG